MSNVVSLQNEREKREPHTAGDTICLNCGHEWVAVIPVGTEVVVCPDCHLEKGIRAGLCAMHDEMHWTCDCGNQFLHLISGGAYCPCCAKAWNWGELLGDKA